MCAQSSVLRLPETFWLAFVMRTSRPTWLVSEGIRNSSIGARILRHLCLMLGHLDAGRGDVESRQILMLLDTLRL